jgi:hypothetical protein
MHIILIPFIKDELLNEVHIFAKINLKYVHQSS